MSNHWDIKCLDCEVYMFVNGEQNLCQAILALTPEIMALYKASCKTYCIWAEGLKIEINSRPIKLQWLQNHQGHQLAAVDQYGPEEIR